MFGAFDVHFFKMLVFFWMALKRNCTCKNVNTQGKKMLIFVLFV